MKRELCSKLWENAVGKMLKCHLSLISPTESDTREWIDAYNSLVQAIEDERKFYPEFSVEITMLTNETGCQYNFRDILEEYFDHLEEKNEWRYVIASAKEILQLFRWVNVLPSEYMYRIGNAYLQQKKYADAEEFGHYWLEQYPNDYYAIASNVFLLIEINKIDEAKELTEKYLKNDLICDNTTDTFYMAAYRLFEKTNDSYAKARVAEKIKEFNQKILN